MQQYDNIIIQRFEILACTSKKRHMSYFQGGWGWLVLLCALVANLLGHGLQLSYGV